MNKRDLQYVVAVADLRSFSQAAERCHVSQPTLSGQIKKLEETLGVQIFERNNKRVMPTDVGEQLIESARRMLQEWEHMQRLADNAKDPFSGPFKLGAFPTLAAYVFPDLIPKVKQALPKVRWILAEEKTAVLIEQLKSGEIDAALLALPVDDEQLDSAPIFEDPFYFAVPTSHPLANRKRVSLNVLIEQPVLLLEEGHCLRDQALDICHMQGATADEDVRATSLETLRHMVKAGTGVTLMPKIAIQLNEADICYIPFNKPMPQRCIGLVWRKTSTRTPVIEQLIRCL